MLPRRIASSNWTEWIDKVSCAANLTAIYLLTMAFFVLAYKPLLAPLEHSRPVALTKAAQQPSLPSSAVVKVVAGRPVRLVVPNDDIDLTVDEGFFDSTTDSWTLSGYDAQFAMMSTLANNSSGETFIYGHNNDYVFGAFRHNTPPVGTLAYIYTDNGHEFEYQFASVVSVGPEQTTVLSYSGPPILLIQTCTGSLNEWRTEYTFDLVKVVQ